MTTGEGKIIVYADTNFHGASREFTESVPDLRSHGFDNRISSIKVISSVWVGYNQPNYYPYQFILEEGEYPNWQDFQGNNDNTITSLKRMDTDPLAETPTIELYADENFGGTKVILEQEVYDLTYYGINEATSSVKVKSGAWVLFDDINFKGIEFIATEGDYPNFGNYHDMLYNNKLSSLKPVKEPAFKTEVISMEFDIAAGLMDSTPVALVNVSQSNKTSADQKVSWSTRRSLTTTKTFDWHWDNSLAIGASTKFTTGVPFIAEGEISLSVENTFSIGQNRGSENTQSDEWGVDLPATVKPNTRLQVQVNIQQGKLDVPFKAVLEKGNKRWEERGVYKGTQSYNIQADYEETPL